ncbi:hypothetical protein [Embleya sp. NPDC001921]
MTVTSIGTTGAAAVGWWVGKASGSLSGELSRGPGGFFVFGFVVVSVMLVRAPLGVRGPDGP